MPRPDLMAAANGNTAAYNALVEVYERLDALDASTTPPSGPPQICQYTVTGEDGNFVIEILNPSNRVWDSLTQKQQYDAYGVDQNYYGATVTHQLQSSLTRNFDASGDVREYGPDNKTRWEVTNSPDQSRYWRLRSSYDGGKTWNKWSEYKNPTICGVVPVWSGQVRSTRQMPRAQLNVTNFATVDSVVTGGTCSIRVYGIGGAGTGWFRKVGAVYEGIDGTGSDQISLTPFPAATLLGYALGTYYEVYYDKQYGVFHVFTEAQHALTLDDRYRFAGSVVTATNGTDATATATVASGAVTAVTVTNIGSDYTSAPTVVFTGGGGTGATAVANMVGGSVVSVTIISGGTGYATAPAVSFSGGRGTTGGGGDTGAAPDLVWMGPTLGWRRPTYSGY